MDVGRDTRAIALDISKAFDKARYTGLLHKLKAYRVRGSILPIVDFFLQDRPIKIILDGQFSTPHAINAGVPQGSVIRPTLFLVYINDLPGRALSRIYAGDTTAYPSIQTPDFFDRLEMTAELEEDLRCIVEWGEKWVVSFNAGKTKLLSFNLHRESSLIPLEMIDIELPENVSFCLLGLVFTHKLDWKHYVQSVAKQTSQRFGSLFQSQTYIPPETILYLYKATIRACMEYCSYIWDGVPQYGCLDLLDTVQRRLVNLIGPVLSTLWLGLQVIR